MAERRMFAKSVVLSDQFLSLPLRAQCLYYNLGMNADDDGFVGNPRSICRSCRATAKDLELLREAGYLICFDSGVVALLHWRVCNLIRSDRYKPTVYKREQMQLVYEAVEQEAWESELQLGNPIVTQPVNPV